ncbi:MAG: hypothetical protein NZ908_02685 [Candidatus Micrarchaeota archaeon]|nr:hypothetical protein [Candidatus Micrarchaeota archaeon]MCX8154440.1 hypothetical protein [Candidatus Micrarchaeota archaeon]
MESIIPNSGFHQDIAKKVRELGGDPERIVRSLNLHRHMYKHWMNLPIVATLSYDEIKENRDIILRILDALDHSSKVRDLKQIISLYKAHTDKMELIDKYLKLAKDDLDIPVISTLLNYNLNVNVLGGARKIHDFRMFYGKIRKYLSKQHIEYLLSYENLDFNKIDNGLGSSTFLEMLGRLEINDRVHALVSLGMTRGALDVLMIRLQEILNKHHIPVKTVLATLHFLESVKDYDRFSSELAVELNNVNQEISNKYLSVLFRHENITPRYNYER